MNPVFFAWQTMTEVVAALPPSLAERVARGVGTSAYYLWFTRRRVARENFARVLSQAPNAPSVGRVARRSFGNYTVYLLNMMRYPHIPREEFLQRVEMHVDPATHELLQQDRPKIFVSAHFGNM